MKSLYSLPGNSFQVEEFIEFKGEKSIYQSISTIIKITAWFLLSYLIRILSNNDRIIFDHTIKAIQSVKVKQSSEAHKSRMAEREKTFLSLFRTAISSNANQSIGSSMIQNEHQYKISQGKIKEIEKSLDKLYKEKKSLHPRQFKMRENGLQGILAEIQEEIEKYDVLKEKPTVIEIESFSEIPVALIKARIASGMTQKDLAEKLGMKEQQIQRYEANQYGSAGFHRLTEVAEALEVTLNSSLLTLRK
jgi:HTH-type transcriptional regulator / antitoxin HipB